MSRSIADGPDGGELSHEDIWDDSTLIKSWNDALDEYKKYHSIHLEGGTANTVKLKLDALDNAKNAHPETNRQTGTVGGTTMDDHVTIESDHVVGEDVQCAAADAAAAVQSPPTASMALPSVQDEGLKKLLMSWYYAGYYTGLYEGQQQQQQPA